MQPIWVAHPHIHLSTKYPTSRNWTQSTCKYVDENTNHLWTPLLVYVLWVSIHIMLAYSSQTVGHNPWEGPLDRTLLEVISDQKNAVKGYHFKHIGHFPGGK